MALIAIDAGTTTTRVWRVAGGVIEETAVAAVGVRDAARDGHNGQLRSALRDLIGQVRHTAAEPVTQIAAAGMITSALGLREVSHVPAPAGVRELAAGAVEFVDRDLCDLPIVLFPGVRCGPWGDQSAIAQTDIMRGEETLCIGLQAEQGLTGGTAINLGSHWKWITLDTQGRIAGSRTTLSGELLYAVMTQTVLASAVPAGRPEVIEPEWCLRGAEAFQGYGLSRTLFTVRLWELQAPDVTAVQRLSYLIGAMVAEAIKAPENQFGNASKKSLWIIGEGGVAAAWEVILESQGMRVQRYSPEATTTAFILGIGELLAARQKA